MGGLAGLFEEFREAIQDKGGDDPALAWAPLKCSSGYGFSIYTSGHSKLPNNSRMLKQHIEYTTADLREEIATCLSILNLCERQDDAINAFYKVHSPRSRSFGFWFDIATDGIAKRREIVNGHLSQIQSGCTIDVATPVLDLPIESRLLDYSIKHIIEDELQYQTADRTELINIIEDATYYIASIEKTPIVWDKANSIWMNYVKGKYPSLIRYDHCCSQCGGELFTGIPYCMSCNSILH